MYTRPLVLFVHVTAATVLVGGSILGPMVRAAVRRARTVQDLRAALLVARPVQVISGPTSLLLLVTGLYLATVGHLWSLPWVGVSAGFWVVNVVAAVAVQKPAVMRLAGAAFNVPDGPVDGGVDELRWSVRWTVAGDLLLANNAAMLFLMTVKPGLMGSLVVPALANAAVVLAAFLNRRAYAERSRPSIMRQAAA